MVYPMNDKAPKPVLVLSQDGTGETAQRVLNAALRQFHNHHLQLRIYGNIKESDRIHTLFRIAAAESAFAGQYLCPDRARRLAARCAKSTTSNMQIFWGRAVAAWGIPRPSLSRSPRPTTADASYFRRIEAVEYTVKADDGKRAADAGQRGHRSRRRVANFQDATLDLPSAQGPRGGHVPIVFDQPLPDQLFDVEASRVFALTIDPSVLQHIRRSRIAAWG